MHNVTLSHVRVILVMKTQQCIPFALFTCVCRQQCNKILKALSWEHIHAFSALLHYTCRWRQYTHTEAPMQSVRYFCPIVTNFGVSRQIFVRAPNIKFHKNPPSGNRRDICGQRQTRERTDTTNVRGAFRDLRSAPKNPYLIDGFFPSFYRKQHKTYFGLPVKCLILLPNFNQTWIFSTDLRKSLQCQISRKSGN
jgi:hypothetical protein